MDLYTFGIIVNNLRYTITNRILECQCATCYIKKHSFLIILGIRVRDFMSLKINYSIRGDFNC